MKAIIVVIICMVLLLTGCTSINSKPYGTPCVRSSLAWLSARSHQPHVGMCWYTRERKHYEPHKMAGWHSIVYYVDRNKRYYIECQLGTEITLSKHELQTAIHIGP